MKKLVAVLMLVATAAWAGERFLGVIAVTDGGSSNNAITGYGLAGCAITVKECSIPQAFYIPPSAKLTVICNSVAHLTANRNTTDAGVGMKLAADEKFPTSTGPAVTVALPDGGTYRGGVLAISPAAGSSGGACGTYERSGTE